MGNQQYQLDSSTNNRKFLFNLYQSQSDKNAYFFSYGKKNDSPTQIQHKHHSPHKSNPPITSQHLYNQLQFHSQIQNYPPYGHCKLFISTKFSSCYIIKITIPLQQSTSPENHANFLLPSSSCSKKINSQTLSLLSELENQQNIYLLSLFAYRMGKNCQCTIKQPIISTVTMYWEYLPISIRDVIERKQRGKTQGKGKGKGLDESQIWYILKAAIYGYQAFRKLRICYDFMPSKMMVNQEGRIRLNWMHVENKNMHSKFVQKLAQKTNFSSISSSSELYLSPQQLHAVSLSEFTHKINYEKSNIFSLGMTLFYCMTLEDPDKFIYDQSYEKGFRYEVIQQNIGRNDRGMGGRNGKLNNWYSADLVGLVRLMLERESKDRIGFDKIWELYAGFLKKDFCINISKPSINTNEPILQLKKKFNLQTPQTHFSPSLIPQTLHPNSPYPTSLPVAISPIFHQTPMPVLPLAAKPSIQVQVSPFSPVTMIGANFGGNFTSATGNIGGVINRGEQKFPKFY